MSDEKVRETDEQHIWYKGKQFIRLDRFLELKTDLSSEMDILGDEIDRLNEENEALKTLLKNKGGI